LDKLEIAISLNTEIQQAGSVTHNNVNETIFSDGDSYFNGLLIDIADANFSVDLESYIFRNDSVGTQFINVLGNAAGRGVVVRVLIDGVGSVDDAVAVVSLLMKRGVDAKIYHPLPWQVNQYRWSIQQGSAIGRLFFFIQNINQRNHRKVCIVDKRIVWTGSVNISAQHLSPSQGGQGWRDISVRVTGGLAPQVRKMFNAIWTNQITRLRRRRFQTFLSNISPINRRRKYRFISNKLNQAKKQIWISSAYFSPSSVFVNALINASNRGVNVRLIVPFKSDVFFFPSLTATYYEALIKSGVEIFEYCSGFLHAKVLMIDEFYLLGSSNFNHRSFLHDLEFDVILTTASARNELKVQFIKDVEESSIITPQQLDARSWQIILGWIPRLLRYWF
jgi:cardiolipin synthase